ncbi:MAG: phosphoethanolamine--lipid A transferase [Gammaproteobacteria bacterium]|nr:phosphoethanolamine--lipid A transferase [Gammaproteobacteria bacterium]
MAKGTASRVVQQYPGVSKTTLILTVALFLVVFHNFTFLQRFIETYDGMDDLWLRLVSIAIIHGCVLTLMLSLLGFSRLLKPLVIALLLISSITAYFVDTYKVIISSEMINNTLETDSAEIHDLLGLRLIAYLLLLGALPSLLVYNIRIRRDSLGRDLKKRLVLASVSLITAVIIIYSSGDFYASFFRLHKLVRYYANPTTLLYSLGKYTNSRLEGVEPKTLTTIGSDATIPASDPHNELVVLVIGETARADHFSLNGYQRETNPLLSRENLVSFTQVSSCGTSTAVSLPCMFSFSERKNYDEKIAAHTENILDVLQRAGVQILWRDNNSGGAKGIANRVEFQDLRKPEINPVCDPECRDEGMLTGLDTWLAQHQDKDILIVMHQMGSHGPAYFKRYPSEFEKFTPTCRSNQLNDCTREAVVNTYDNTILYTDYFLSRVIAWLKAQSAQYQTSMLYMSDHGESLGELGIYLHGIPYALAPAAQTHVPAILWSAEQNTDIDLVATKQTASEPFSHDNLFHTLLGLFEVKSEIYQRDKDMVSFAHSYP